MAGIVSYGAYIPRYRLGRETAGWGMPIEKAVCNFDEDSITMAVAAGFDCITDADRDVIDSLIFATTTSPYIEKQGASIIAAAVDLGRNIITNDITNSLRAGTLAMRSALDAITAGSAHQVLVTIADARTGTPRSEFDQSSGDGAAALLFGNDRVIANVIGSYSISDEIMDSWRAEGDVNVRSWEDRWVYQTGYLKILPEAINGLMQKLEMDTRDVGKVAIYGPNARRHGEMVRQLGFDQSQIQDPLFGKMGDTGTAFTPMLLIAALEEAKPGDKILIASYGDGADAYLLEVTSEIEKLSPRHGVKGNIEAKRIRRSVGVRGATMQATAGGAPSISARYRDREEIDRFYGGKCQSCGLIQYPPQRVCTRCHTKDSFDSVRLSDRKGEIFTFSMDYLNPGVDSPMVITAINFDGGGRAMLMLTDRELDDVKCDAPVEISFRKLRASGGVHNYFWKAIPTRF